MKPTGKLVILVLVVAVTAAFLLDVRDHRPQSSLDLAFSYAEKELGFMGRVLLALSMAFGPFLIIFSFALWFNNRQVKQEEENLARAWDMYHDKNYKWAGEKKIHWKKE